MLVGRERLHGGDAAAGATVVFHDEARSARCPFPFLETFFILFVPRFGYLGSHHATGSKSGSLGGKVATIVCDISSMMTAEKEGRQKIMQDIVPDSGRKQAHARRVSNRNEDRFVGNLPFVRSEACEESLVQQGRSMMNELSPLVRSSGYSASRFQAALQPAPALVWSLMKCPTVVSLCPERRAKSQ